MQTCWRQTLSEREPSMTIISSNEWSGFEYIFFATCSLMLSNSPRCCFIVHPKNVCGVSLVGPKIAPSLLGLTIVAKTRKRTKTWLSCSLVKHWGCSLALHYAFRDSMQRERQLPTIHRDLSFIGVGPASCFWVRGGSPPGIKSSIWDSARITHSTRAHQLQLRVKSCVHQLQMRIRLHGLWMDIGDLRSCSVSGNWMLPFLELGPFSSLLLSVFRRRNTV